MEESSTKRDVGTTDENVDDKYSKVSEDILERSGTDPKTTGTKSVITEVSESTDKKSPNCAATDTKSNEILDSDQINLKDDIVSKSNTSSTVPEHQINASVKGSEAESNTPIGPTIQSVPKKRGKSPAPQTPNKKTSLFSFSKKDVEQNEDDTSSQGISSSKLPQSSVESNSENITKTEFEGNPQLSSDDTPLQSAEKEIANAETINNAEINPDETTEPKSGTNVSKKKSLSFRESNVNSVKEENRKDTDEDDQEEDDMCEEGNDEGRDVILRNRKTLGVAGEDRPQTRASFMMKTKGKLYYKKKGPFAKRKLFFVVVDDYKMQMNFFKSQEDYEKLALCKMSIDLRFATEVKAQKQKLLQTNFPFKLQRRAGLSTIKLAAFNEEERAKWIIAIEGIMQKVKITSELEFIPEEKRSSTLPNRAKDRVSSDSETHTTASAPDQEELIRPKKVSSIGFKLNSNQISSIKLKRVSSDKENNIKHEDISKGEEVCDPKEKFGVNLRRVQTEKQPPRDAREQSPEYVEFKQKYNSLSLSRERKNMAPKIPLNENSTCSYLLENIKKQETKPNDQKSVPTKDTKDTKDTKGTKDTKEKDVNRKRSPSPNIPISKAVEAVMKNKPTDENSATINEKPKPKLSVCHATSAVISFDEPPTIITLDGATPNTKQKSLKKETEHNFAPSEEKTKTVLSTNITSDIANPESNKKHEHTMEIPTIRVDNTSENDTQIEGHNLCEPGKIETALETHGEEGSQQDVDLKNNVPISVTKINTQAVEHEVGNSTSNVNSECVANDTLVEAKTDNNDVTPLQPISSDSKDMELKKVDMNTDNTAENIIEAKSTVESKQSKKEEKKFADSSEDASRKSVKVDGIMTEKQIELILSGKEPNTEKNSNSDKFSNELAVLKYRNHENRVSNYSFQSQTSTESDEPLPRLNLLGKADRSSSSSGSLKDSATLDESKRKSIDSEESPESCMLREKSLKSSVSGRPDISNSLEVRSSLILPEFTVVEEKPSDLVSHDAVRTEENMSINGDSVDANNSSIKSVSSIECQKEINSVDEPGSSISVAVSETVRKEEINSIVENKPLKTISLQQEDKSKVNRANTDVTEQSKQLANEIKREGESFEISEENKESQKTTNIENKVSTHKIFLSYSDCSAPKNMTTNTSSDADVKEPASQDISQSTVSNKYNQINFIDEDSLGTAPPIQSSINTIGDDVKGCDNITTESTPPDCPKDSSKCSNPIKEEKEGVLKEFEFEEAQDYFPTFGDIEYRVKDDRLNVSDDVTLRTSGITGLKEFLKENESSASSGEVKAGINRLGHSPAIEKLRKEV